MRQNIYVRPGRRAALLFMLLLVTLTGSPALATHVVIETDLGDIEVMLYDDAAPETVANFLNYVNDSDYDRTFIHRSMPGFVIQGGGFAFIDEVVTPVPADPPVVNEPGISNTRGTIAMAKFPSDPDSATSEWFINLADNSANLDSQNGGFTVFGEVVGDGMTVVDAIAALQVWNAGSPFTDLPLIDYPGGVPITAEHLVMLDIRKLSEFVINPGLNDAWVNPLADFQGMFITVFPSLKLLFLAWFTFDSAPQVSLESSGSVTRTNQSMLATFGADDQRWVTAVGSYDGNRAELRAELTTGGVFNASDPLPVQDTEYGSIILEFEDCSLAHVDFDFPSAGESGNFDITRTLGDNIPLCEALNTGDDSG
jgi:cyclophilin family peptidyl-prolyl cis-trans isomerase